uniref:LTXXQ motif family protein n=1 Tax=mine drainage metagenome TaxID=410659 RepID=E6QQD8_9ZZZZ
MNFLKPVLSILAASLLVVTIAQADQTSTNPPAASAPVQQAPMGKHRMIDPLAMAQKHLEHLKSVLKITPDEEPAWQAYTEKVHIQVKKMTENRELMHHEHLDKTITTPDRMEEIAGNMKARAQDMAEMADATKMLYDKLTPEQRAEFDQTTEQEANKFHHMMHNCMEHAPMNKSVTAIPGNSTPVGQ